MIQKGLEVRPLVKTSASILCRNKLVNVDIFVVFSWYSLSIVAFKITNKLKVNNDNLKFNGDFKSHITVERIPKKQYFSNKFDDNVFVNHFE
jgi:hypothetical protein